MQATTIKIPVEKIILNTDRKHGGQGDLKTLAKSIEEHGLIQPPAVKKGLGGAYHVAGAHK